MAKKTKSKKTYYKKNQVTRSRVFNSKQRLRSALYDDYNNRFIESRRTYNATPYTSKRRIPSNAPKIQIIKQPKRLSKPVKLYTSIHTLPSTPQRTMICVRRKIRKQVLHALNKSGKSGQRSPTQIKHSHIKC